VNRVTYEIVTRRARRLGTLPAMPGVLTTLCDALSVQAGKADVGKIVQTICYDKSLVAQCLRIANSALYRQRGDVATVRDAVLALGLWRIRDLAFTCSLPLMFSNWNCAVPKEFFWRHALATAVVSQKLGKDFANGAGEQFYLAGLLHDIGILVNALLFPVDFREVIEQAVREHSDVASIEERVMGFTHAESGRIVAELWRLPLEVSEVIEFHHRPEEQKSDNELTIIVQIANQLCWNSGLGYFYPVPPSEVKSTEDSWQSLCQKFPKANRMSWKEYAPVLESSLESARELADHVFGATAVSR
jgi:HD-like signal output (HDOD) protein